MLYFLKSNTWWLCASSTGSPVSSLPLGLLGSGSGPGRVDSGGRGKEPATLLPPYLLLITYVLEGPALWDSGQRDRGSRPLSPWPHLPLGVLGVEPLELP